MPATQRATSRPRIRETKQSAATEKKTSGKTPDTPKVTKKPTQPQEESGNKKGAAPATTIKAVVPAEKKKEKEADQKAEATVNDFLTNHATYEGLRAEFVQLTMKYNITEKEHLKCCANREKVRYDDIPCLDETRVTIPDDANFFVHANNVTFGKDERNYIIATAPMPNTIEDFWRMVFHSESKAVVLLCQLMEKGNEKCESFWPTTAKEYKTFGKMWINNKKVECESCYTVYTLEVLPEGCSNSLITKLYHFYFFNSEGALAHIRTFLKLQKAVAATAESGPITVVSSEGISRAPIYVAVDILIARLNRAVPAKLADVSGQIRKQRAHSFKIESDYIWPVFIVNSYIDAKWPRMHPICEKFNKDVREKI